MVEHALAQVVLDALAQDAGQVDEAEHRAGLHEDQPAIQADDLHQPRAVARHDALVHDLLAQEGEQRIQERHQRDQQQKANHPTPVGTGQAQDAPHGAAAELALKLFFF